MRSTPKLPKNCYFRPFFDHDVTWWRHNANIFPYSLSPLKNLSIDVLHDHVWLEKFFGPHFAPWLWRHGTILGGQWRHQIQDRKILSRHANFRKNSWSRFCGAQKLQIVDTFKKSGPLEKKYAHATWLDRNFFQKSHFIRLRKRISHTVERFLAFYIASMKKYKTFLRTIRKSV